MGNTPSNTSPPVRPPMKIHQIHGKNLTIAPDRLGARRHEGYSDGIFFGSRPAVAGEKFEITVIKMISEWNGALRFGFTSHNPIAISSHPEGIPRYMCPDLIKRGGSYVETISQISLRAKDRIVYWLEPTGEVSLKVNEVLQKCQLHGINKDVWPVVDVYGNTVEVTFRCLDDNMDLIHTPTEPRFYSSLRLSPFPIIANLESVKVLESDTVCRNLTKKAYAWNINPLPANVVWVLFVNEVDHSIGNNLSIAILKAAPQNGRLPDKFGEFNRGLGWVIENVYVRMIPGDELAICILNSGNVLVAINGESFEELTRVPPNSFYWIAVDINCSVISLTSVGTYKMTRYPLPTLPVIPNISELDIRGANAGDLRKPSASIKESKTFASIEEVSRPVVPPPVVQKNNTESSLRSGAECVICLDLVPDNVFIPCGHVCCCKACADNLMNEHGNHFCPACRNPIESSYKVYL